MRHKAGVLTVSFLLGIALHFQEELDMSEEQADMSCRGKCYGDGRKIEEEELLEQMRNEL